MNNNPLRYADPTGHYACGDGETHSCIGNKQDPNKNPHPPKPPTLPLSKPKNTPNGLAPVQPSAGCSVVLLSCQKEDQSLGIFYSVSNLAYPQTQYAMDPADKMSAEFTPVWWVNAIILLHDLASIPLGSNIVAKYVTHENAYAIVKYELRKTDFGNSPYIISFSVVNNTNSSISVKGFHTELFVGEPSATTNIQPGATTNVVIIPNPIMANSITIDMSHGMSVTAMVSP